jgi:hypothetical protein
MARSPALKGIVHPALQQAPERRHPYDAWKLKHFAKTVQSW